jgi:acetylornithine deacetylase/succinyl-diaminopimelate desuccinylase-like protein
VLVSRLARGAHQLRRRRPRGRPRRAPAVFGTNGSISAARGIPTVIFGSGDPELAHQDEEFIRLDELERGRRQFAALASIASR